ncbi:thiamine phosphate synthase [Alkalicoccus saliphilus]|uniref:Thiamine phosphate synthase/TenI domain-containing protein n=1 Tax=Alkalicoccus saliphilus TaxID=200989 RepID=A0A2T4U2E7_9BACI|nr:thiamine phosphate synthase [Alkalicoccus saliphilus]PTL37567.1 hypothetical protein C6Y45_15805 [Alkalicoccus saliphilus]
MELHVLSTGQMAPEDWARKAALVEKSADFLHIREPFWNEKNLSEALKLYEERAGDRRKIIVNAKTAGATKSTLPLHLPETFLNQAPEGKWGISVHSREAALAAERAGASWIMAGPVFDPGSKNGVQGRGMENILKMTEGLQIPVIAVGGLTPDRLRELAGKVHGAAVVSGIMGQEDPAAAAEHYRKVIRRWETS